MIVGNLWFRIGDSGQQSGLTYIGQTYQTYIGNDLQFQHEIQLFGRPTGLRVFRRLHGTGGIMLVSATASAPLQENDSPIVTGHIYDHLSAFSLLHHRSLRNLQYNVPTVLSPAVFLVSRITVLSLILSRISEINESVQSLVNLQNHVAALSAVSAVRPACRDILFSAE